MQKCYQKSSFFLAQFKKKQYLCGQNSSGYEKYGK